MAFNPMSMRWGKLYEGTPAEKSLEDAVAALGVPYRTQFPGWKYGCRFFPDFLLPTLKVVIEVDDPSHDDPEKMAADVERTRVIFDTWGAQVVRIPNKKALTDPHGSIRAALSEVGLWPLPKNLPRLRDSLPPLRKAPKRERREAKSRARRAARKTGRGSA
jgi:very-short-patch-repair endonuclease